MLKWQVVVPASFALTILGGVGGFFIGSAASQRGQVLVTGTPSAAIIASYGPAPADTAGSPYDPNAVVTISDHSRVAELVAFANGLPRVPDGGYSCPRDDGAHYQVRFTYGDGDRVTLIAERHGCQFVSLNDGSLAVAWSLTDARLLNYLDAVFR